MMRKSKSKLSGFTLIEVLVVVVIIVLLITLLVPSLRQFQNQIGRGRSQAIINLIDGACKMYYQDFKAYPLSTPDGAWYGRHRLVQALTGYLPRNDDGQDGYGFRTQDNPPRWNTIVYGPYNGTEKLQVKHLPTDTDPYVFLDTFGNQIFYYRYDETAKKYQADHNSDAAKAPLQGGYETTDGTQLFQTTFLLMSAGADKEFTAWRDNNSTDDVTNFFPGAK